jgi:hypothetical protein
MRERRRHQGFCGKFLYSPGSWLRFEGEEQAERTWRCVIYIFEAANTCFIAAFFSLLEITIERGGMKNVTARDGEIYILPKSRGGGASGAHSVRVEDFRACPGIFETWF